MREKWREWNQRFEAWGKRPGPMAALGLFLLQTAVPLRFDRMVAADWGMSAMKALWGLGLLIPGLWSLSLADKAYQRAVGWKLAGVALVLALITYLQRR